MGTANQYTVLGVLETANQYTVQGMLCSLDSGLLPEEPQYFSNVDRQ